MYDDARHLLARPESFPGLPALPGRSRRLSLLHAPPFGVSTSLSLFEGRGSFLVRRVQAALARPEIRSSSMVVGSDALPPPGPAAEIVGRASALASTPHRAFAPMIDGVVCTAQVAGGTVRFHADVAENAAARAIFLEVMGRLDSWLPYSTLEALRRAEIA